VDAPRAVIFDFNGTLSDDEPILYRIYADLFAAHGRPLSRRDYLDLLAGHSDEEIVARWLGRDRADVDALVAERIARYRAAVAGGATIRDEARAAVRCAAERVPVGVVSGAAREELEPLLAAAGLVAYVRVVVCADDVRRGKPHPEGYRLALERLRGSEPQSPLRAGDVLVFEDTEAGVAAAKAAGMRCVAVAGTLDEARLAGADAIVARLDADVLARLLD
jgi:HAD superfamily hydrolase (TIGR01509 family)